MSRKIIVLPAPSRLAAPALARCCDADHWLRDDHAPFQTPAASPAPKPVQTAPNFLEAAHFALAAPGLVYCRLWFGAARQMMAICAALSPPGRT
jgi:hypothetical protein